MTSNALSPSQAGMKLGVQQSKLAAIDRQLSEVYRAALKNDAANRERAISNQK
jgi:hypothetical protein